MNQYKKAILVTVPLIMGLKFYFSGGKGLLVRQVYNNQEGRVILVTGGNDGIGLETVKYLASNGASTIIIASRNQERGLAVIQQLKEELASNKTKVGQIEFMKLDLSDLNSVKEFILEFKNKYTQIDTIINNAGIYLGIGASAQGYEKIFATNYIAHFYLTTSLLCLMKDNPESRIINVSSALHNECAKDFSFHDSALASALFSKLSPSKKLLLEMENYSSSKLGNIMFTFSLKLYLEGKKSQVQVYSLHPGVVRTSALYQGIFQTSLAKLISIPAYPIYWLLTKSVYNGSLTTINLACLPSSKLVNGGYYCDCQLNKSSKASYDSVSQIALWNKTVNLLEAEGHKVCVPLI